LPTLGILAVAGAAGAAVLHGGDAATAGAAAVPHKDLFAASASRGQAPATVSRSAERPPIPNVAAVEGKIEGLRYATGPIDIHADAKSTSPVLATVAYGDSVDITGETNGKWAQIVHNGVPRWVEAASISAEQPLGTAPCASGSSVEKGLRPDTIKVHRAVCAKFPSIMISSDLGNEVAAFLQENRAELGIEYLIWRQRIWRPATSGSWRGMSDRGGATANHMDHVHVTTYGSSATR
jgi:hypothetical protein